MAASNASELRSLLEECGYSGSRLAVNYAAGESQYPLVGFACRPWDFDSSCIAVVSANGDPVGAVAKCRDLGTPVVWVRNNGLVEWWVQQAHSPRLLDTKPLGAFKEFVRNRKNDLAPASIYRAKTLSRLPRQKQLDFVDAGLMPLLREEAGERLGSLVEEMISAALGPLGAANLSQKRLRSLFVLIFRLLAGKILRDKDVRGFEDLDLTDVRSVLTRVWQHYSAGASPPELQGKWLDAMTAAGNVVSDYANIRVVSPETLAYVYEHTLVNKDVRRKLGIHATPPWLVDYVVWQLYDWIRELAPEERHVLEPACGHAPFLLGAMRLLRLEMQDEPEIDAHSYLKGHIHGLEVDDFAREIARLSLTLADVPNPDGWDLRDEDIYSSGMLQHEAQRCRVLLSNPPYERFSDAEARRYRRAGYPVQHRKAIELLHRTLPHLAQGTVVGVVLPQGFLHSNEARAIRSTLARDFEIRELCLFADKVFDEGDAETVVLLARRTSREAAKESHVLYRRVREGAVARFSRDYRPDSERLVRQADLAADNARTFRLPDLPDVWKYLARNPRLREVAEVGQGFSFAERGAIARAREAGQRRTGDAVPAFLSGVRNLSIWQTPPEAWLSPRRTPVLTWRSGNYTGKPQVLVNYSPVSRGPWRIKALIDRGGHAVTNTYSTVRPRRGGPPIVFLWAILNSPIANAHVYCNALKRHIYDSLIGALPMPANWPDHVPEVEAAARAYLGLVGKRGAGEGEICTALLQMDAAVARAYGLPVQLEREVLELFRPSSLSLDPYPRKGVGCQFREYFPAELQSLIPLHVYASAGYQASSLRSVADRMTPDQNEELLQTLRAASDAFGAPGE